MSDTTVSQVREAFEAWYLENYKTEFNFDLSNSAMLLHKAGLLKAWEAQASNIATMQKELADVKEDLSTYMQIAKDLTNENVEFCSKIESQTKELAACQLANKQMREAGKQFSHIIQMGSPSCQKRVVEQCKCTNCVSERFEALSLPSTTDTLDAYVSEAVKTALKGFNSDK